MSRIDILAEIDKLEAKHCETCTIDRKGSTRYCISSCDIGKKIGSLGDQLLENDRKKTEELLKKGENMTTSDIEYLVNNQVNRSEIIKALGMGQDGRKLINEIMEGIELGNKRKVIKELMDKGMGRQEIHKKTGFKFGTIDNYMSDVRRAAKQTKQQPKKEVKKVTKPIKEAPAIDYKSKYEELKKQFDELGKKNDETEKMKDEYRDQVNNLTIVNSDLEAKVKSLDESLDYQEGINKSMSIRNDELVKQNETLKNRFDEIVEKAEKKIAALEIELATERAKHRTLFTYITLDKEVV